MLRAGRAGPFVGVVCLTHCLVLARLRRCVGAVTQTIKEVVQSLVDDSMVELEKIGSSNYYWSFPSKALCLVRAHRVFCGRPRVPTAAPGCCCGCRSARSWMQSLRAQRQRKKPSRSSKPVLRKQKKGVPRRYVVRAVARHGRTPFV